MSLLSVNYTNFHSLSFSQIRQLASCAQSLKQEVEALPLKDRIKALNTFKEGIDHLNQSVQDYHPSVCRWLLDLVTFRCCKRLRLRNIIPRVLQAAQNIPQNILGQQAQGDSPDSPPSPVKPPEVNVEKSTQEVQQVPGKSAPKNDKKPLNMENHPLQSLEEQDAENQLLYGAPMSEAQLIAQGIIKADKASLSPKQVTDKKIVKITQSLPAPHITGKLPAKNPVSNPPKAHFFQSFVKQNNEDNIKFAPNLFMGENEFNELLKSGALNEDPLPGGKSEKPKSPSSVTLKTLTSMASALIAAPPIVAPPIAVSEEPIIAKKLQLVLAANECLQLQKKEDSIKKSTEAMNIINEAEGYFKEWLIKLHNKENIPLPIWHYPVKFGQIKQVLEKSQLKPSEKDAAMVIYSNDESLPSEDYVIVMDEANSVGKYKAEYYPNENVPSGGFYASLKVYIKENVVLSKETVPFIVCPVPVKGLELAKLLADAKFDVPIVSRELSYIIHWAFESVNKTRKLPSGWRRSVDQHITRLMPMNFSLDFEAKLE